MLTCTISDLDANKSVVVTWKDPAGGEVSDDDNYDLDQGTVDDSATGVQNAVLTIKPTKLADFISQSSFTYKCSVRSSQYPASPSSTEVDVVANVDKLIGAFF